MTHIKLTIKVLVHKVCQSFCILGDHTVSAFVVGFQHGKIGLLGARIWNAQSVSLTGSSNAFLCLVVLLWCRSSPKTCNATMQAYPGQHQRLFATSNSASDMYIAK